jgi:HEAT repeat protein
MMEDTIENNTNSKSIVGGLIKSLSSNNSVERKRAREILVNIGKPAMGYLEKLSTSRIFLERREAVKTAAQINDPSGIHLLVKALDDPHFEIRWIAAEGLIDLGKVSLMPLLLMLMDKYESVFFRQGAHHVLSGLKIRGYYTDSNRLLSLLQDINGESYIPVAVKKELDRIRALKEVI